MLKFWATKKSAYLPQDGSNNQLRCWLGPTAVCLVGFCFAIACMGAQHCLMFWSCRLKYIAFPGDQSVHCGWWTIVIIRQKQSIFPISSFKLYTFFTYTIFYSTITNTNPGGIWLLVKTLVPLLLTLKIGSKYGIIGFDPSKYDSLPT